MAKLILTNWGPAPGDLNEYAAKTWSGMVGGYYAGRWKAYFDAALQGREPDIVSWERRWIATPLAAKEAPRADWGKRFSGIMERMASLIAAYDFQLLTAETMAVATASGTEGSGFSGGPVVGAWYPAPGKAVDGVVRQDRYWAAVAPAWLKIDLIAAHKSGKIIVVPYWDGTRFYQYTVEVSEDGKSWVRVGDRSSNRKPSTPEGDAIVFSPRTFRYVRVNMLYNSANPSVHLVEVKVIHD